MTKNFSAVRRQTNRQHGGTGGFKSLVSRTNSGSSDQGTSSTPQETAPSEPPDEAESNKWKFYKKSVEDEATFWAPGASTAFKILVSLRMSAGIWSPISDCDETYNYWEPLHMLLYGVGMQTWEYSPVYALRSYAYLYLHTLPVRLFQFLLPHTKVTTFFYLRCFLGFLSALAEVYFFKVLCRRFGNSIGRLYLVFTALGAGMFIASCAFLPSTFAMTLSTLAFALWLDGRNFYAILAVALASLLGWPFAAILGLPIVLDMISEKRKLVQFVGYSLMCGWSVCTVLVAVDTHFYGKYVLAPLNILIYNVFSGHGPTLYGTEPLSYYLVNLSLNWTLAWPLALSSTLVTPIVFKLSNHKPDWSRYRPVLFLQLAMLLWILVFFNQPHKEERFLYPMYPLICVCGALGLDGLERLITGFGSSGREFYKRTASCCTAGAVIAFVLLSGSRSFAIYRNYHAPFDVYMSLSERLSMEGQSVGGRNVPDPNSAVICVGKEWHRFPSHFFLPERLPGNRTLEYRFIKSEFRGLLPKHYATVGVAAATRMTPTGMNDMNLEEMDRYVDVSSCNYLIDLETPRTTELEPNFAAIKSEWVVIHKEPFLLAEKSHRLFRAFYVPFLSEMYTTMGRYNLLGRTEGFQSKVAD